MLIFGAGMAGLLAAHMLRRFSPVVCELQSKLPNNHDALLRFRSDAVSKATGIPFKKVLVHKVIKFQDRYITRPHLGLSNLYSGKVTGEYISRSIMSLDPVERYIAPPDFISQMAKSIHIKYDMEFERKYLLEGEPVISTIPMPAMMDIMEWDDRPKFNHRAIYTFSCDILSPTIDLYQTIYYPGREPYYRVSITGRRVQVEMTEQASTLMITGKELEVFVSQILANDFGIVESKMTAVKCSRQQYGKITPIDAKARKAFILYLTDRYNLYSIGRFATWRQILMDDVVDDVHFVESCISDRDAYQRLIDPNPTR
jgi:hypothetical protein